MKKELIFLTVLSLITLSAYHLFNNNAKDEQIFESWKQQFGFSFSGHERMYRQLIFLQNYKDIVSHNMNPDRSYDKGLNHFSHLSPQEFQSIYSSLLSSRKDAVKTIETQNVVQKENQLTDVDWTKLDKVSIVKNQGSCDAGYAFCTVSLAQSYFLMKNQNITLSQQQVVDCAQNYTTFGCNGGSRLGTLDYVRKMGLTLQSKYPWKGVKNACSNPSGGQNKVNINVIQSNGCTQLLKNIYTSPITVAVNARQMQSYKAGVFDGCNSTEVTHDILMVGATPSYWKLKNSWGQSWGEYGYMRLKSGNTCGVCQKVGYGFKEA